jgi:hypothetical protein
MLKSVSSPADLNPSNRKRCRCWVEEVEKRLKLFIVLAFHTIFAIFLSAQTYLIIITFYVLSRQPPSLPHFGIYFSVLPNRLSLSWRENFPQLESRLIAMCGCASA